MIKKYLPAMVTGAISGAITAIVILYMQGYFNV